MTSRALLLPLLAALAAGGANGANPGRPAGAAGRAGEGPGDPGADSTYGVYAIRYATIPGFPIRALIADADSGRTLDLAMMVWLLKGARGRNVLVDVGFHRQRYIDRFHPRDYRTAAAAVAAAGVAPEQVTDVILSHMHWDHAGGLDLFPNARIWVQKAEYDYYTSGAGASGNTGVDRDDAALLVKLHEEGRVTLVDGDDREILPGIRVYTGGRHTYASQYAGVHTDAGTVVVASDNVYLYENLERHVPIAQTFDAASNLRAQDRMRRLAADVRLIVPGHDPEVFVRFPEPGNGIARIR